MVTRGNVRGAWLVAALAGWRSIHVPGDPGGVLRVGAIGAVWLGFGAVPRPDRVRRRARQMERVAVRLTLEVPSSAPELPNQPD